MESTPLVTGQKKLQADNLSDTKWKLHSGKLILSFSILGFLDDEPHKAVYGC